MNLIQLYEIDREGIISSILWLNKLWLRKVKQLAQYPTYTQQSFIPIEENSQCENSPRERVLIYLAELSSLHGDEGGNT